MNSLGQAEARTNKSSLVDKELLLNVQNGDETAIESLIAKYENIVYKKASTYFLIGSDRDDVVQEGLIGLYKAICDYDEKKLASFKSFAELCITRQIISSIKSATRQKHAPLNSYVSFYKPVQEDDSERILLDTIIHEGDLEPHGIIERKEHFLFWQSLLMKALTKLEWDVLYYYLQGYSYEEISDEIGRHEKSIDNALQRIKRKIEILLKENELPYE